MEQLRENYQTGERFYAQDMNKVTHTINELGNRIKFVEQLPKEGEGGVIYSLIEHGIECAGISKIDDSINLSVESDIITSVTLSIGDVIQVNEASADTIYAINIDDDGVYFDTSSHDPVLKGINDYSYIINGHKYRITGVYPIKLEDIPEMYKPYYRYNIFTFEDVTNDTVTYDYLCNNLPSIYILYSEPYKITYGVPLINYEDMFIPVHVEDLITIYNYKVGDIIKATDNNIIEIEDGGETCECILITEVDDSVISIDENSGDGAITGITDYIEWEKDHYYRIIDKIILASEMGVYIYEEVTNPAKVDYELKKLPCVFEQGYYDGMVLEKHRNAYLWDNGVYQQIG